MPKQKKNKVPEKQEKEKTNYLKGESRALKKRLDNLEKRVRILEEKLEKYNLSPDELNFGKPKKKPQKDIRKEFVKKHHPKNKENE